MSVDFVSLYQDVIFIADKDFDANSFAIITACNPLGRVLNLKENTDLTQELKGHIGAESYWEVVGSSPDRRHQEPSFFWQTDKAGAMKMADHFLQNAIYWVEAGELFLVPVKMAGKEVSMGKFKDFLIIE